jgi:hypothetical protein
MVVSRMQLALLILLIESLDTFQAKFVMMSGIGHISKIVLRAIDGTHVPVKISPSKQIPYIGRKGIPTQNVMDV